MKVARKKEKPVKRYVQFLSLCKDPASRKLVLQKAPESVIKAICNASLNASNGDIRLTPKQKKLFKRYQPLFQHLNSRQESIPKKRKLLVQKGGLAILPIILSTVLGSLGSALFSK